MKLASKVNVRVEMVDVETDKTVKQVFSNVKPDQTEEAIAKLGDITMALTKGDANLTEIYETVEYQIVPN